MTAFQRAELLRRLRRLHRDLNRLKPGDFALYFDTITGEYDGIKFALAVLGYRVIERGEYWPVRIAKAV